ncbi:uncharacterized protein LOC129976607 isoform X2 [Argiope bruennichi]|uniref:uncharacterized protein LOC129976607 isoform X2 n=1 Tax=Argiope bruennichi TaxID=94029 RepID=UPI0024941543|nr:uncharacterized protein LOC129976607 isoform X2 [Argiope bruennichi]
METFNMPWIALALIALSVDVLCNPLINDHLTEVTYDELEALGTSCYPLDTCKGNTTNLGLNIFNCDCDSSCSMYDTCCVDSDFRIHKNSPRHKSNLKCLSVYNNPGYEIYMVDTCKNDESFDNLCLSNPEESDDPFLIIPVTSNVTGITYKNYFCAVCNEDVDSKQLEFWDMEVLGNSTFFKNLSEPQFKYDKTIKSWTVFDGKSTETPAAVPVILNIQHNSHAKYCTSSLLETCSSNWTDEAVAVKCRDYMAIVFTFPNVKYRNPHCALCNFENLSDLRCVERSFAAVPASIPSGAADIPLINLFVLEDRQRRCGKNMVYDKFADKCRCNSRIYTKENGKCVHKI